MKTQPSSPAGSTRRALRQAAVLLVAGLAALPSSAQQALPTGAEVLDRYIQVSGGAAAWAGIRSRVSTGTLTLAGSGLTLRMTAVSGWPNKALVTLEAEAVGVIQRGCTGEVAWESTTMGGPRLLAGQERADMLRDTRIEGLAAWRELYTASERATVEDVAGKPTHVVILSPRDGGLPRTWLFDAETGLPVKMRGTFHTPGGEVVTEIVLSDFRKVDGVLVEHRRETRALGQPRILTLDSVQHNVELPPERFDPPAGVQELLARHAQHPTPRSGT